jgi:hypothetical protein
MGEMVNESISEGLFLMNPQSVSGIDTIKSMRTQLHISYIERQSNLLVIAFSDGRCALYTAELLHSILPQAIQVLDRNDRQTGKQFHELPRFDDRAL